MGKTEEVDQKEAAVKPTKIVELLICKCNDCTHWEFGREDNRLFLLCKTCGLEVNVVNFEIDDHHMLHWAEHER